MKKQIPQDPPHVGLLVFWYPGAKKDSQTIPMIGIINRAWSKGTADLSIFPVQDGAVIAKDMVWHIDDPRLIDGYGNISPAGETRGAWEYTPASLAYLKSVGEEPKVEEDSKPEDNKPQRSKAK